MDKELKEEMIDAMKKCDKFSRSIPEEVLDHPIYKKFGRQMKFQKCSKVRIVVSGGKKSFLISFTETLDLRFFLVLAGISQVDSFSSFLKVAISQTLVLKNFFL